MSLEKQYSSDINIENKVANNYDFLFSNIISYKENRKKIINYIKNNFNKNTKILDIGCGSGILIKELEQEGFNNLYGIDPSSEMIKQSINKCDKAIFKIGFAENIEYPDNYFDLIIGTAFLHHIKDLYLVEKEIKRLLKNNGNILFHEPSNDWFFEKMNFYKKILKIIIVYPIKLIPFLKNYKIKKYKKSIGEDSNKLPFHRHIPKKEIIDIFGNDFNLDIRTENIFMPFFESWLIDGKIDYFFYILIKKIDKKIRLEGLNLIIKGSKK